MVSLSLTPDTLCQTDPSSYRYSALLQGLTEGDLYPYGAGWLGREVGQRTLSFRSDYANPITSVLVPRDDLFLTQIRVREKLLTQTLGIQELPVWMAGSGRVRSDVPFPDKSLWHALATALTIADPTSRVLSARYSRDPFGGVETGPGTPQMRQAYWLPYNPTSTLLGNLQYESQPIRSADSFWDFSTAGDPVYILLEQSTGILIRNLEPLIQVNFTLPQGLADGNYLVLQTSVSGAIGSSYLEDTPGIFFWPDEKSLSDTKYLPGAQAYGLSFPDYDISSGRGNTGVILPSGAAAFLTSQGPGYTIPRSQEYLSGQAKGLGPWPSATFAFPIQEPASGTGYGLFRGPALTSVSISDSSGEVLGTAYPIDLRNSWDRSGEFIGLLRKTGESDPLYASRQQRTLLTGVQERSSGSAGRVNRTLSTVLGRSVLSSTWDGTTGSLVPQRTTGVDALLDRGESLVLSLNDGSIFPLSSLPETETAVSRSGLLNGDLWTSATSGYIAYSSIEAGSSRGFKCAENLLLWDSVQVFINNQLQIPGRDYLISAEDPTIILFSQGVPLTQTSSVLTLRIQVSGKRSCLGYLADDILQEPLYSSWSQGRSPEDLEREALPSRYRTTVVSQESPLWEGGTQYGSASGSLAFPLESFSGIDTPNNYRGPVLLTLGSITKSLSQIENRRLYAPGHAYPTPLGQSLFEMTPTHLWGTVSLSPGSSSSLPMDLVNPPYIP